MEMGNIQMERERLAVVAVGMLYGHVLFWKERLPEHGRDTGHWDGHGVTDTGFVLAVWRARVQR